MGGEVDQGCSMIITAHNEVYKADVLNVIARGILYSVEDVNITLIDRVSSILWDNSGREDVGNMLSKLATTSFAIGRLSEILDYSPETEDWRIGEAMAEAYLTDCRECVFPWPCWRDLKNPHASPAGTDLVGFQVTGMGFRFAFAEVKTSQERNWPPTVVKGRHGLAKQLEDLRDSYEVKDQLVRYLAYRAEGASWLPKYHDAAARYLGDPADVTLFGVLIRDVEPKDADLASRARVLADNCPEITSIELRALYLPEGAIESFVDQVKSKKGGD